MLGSKDVWPIPHSKPLLKAVLSTDMELMANRIWCSHSILASHRNTDRWWFSDPEMERSHGCIYMYAI
jgi:hypothetical protein